MAIFKVRYYKEKEQAKLIQRMLVWQGYGCPIEEDPSVSIETGGKPSAVLFRYRTPVASGFFEAVEWLKANALSHNKKAPLNKDRVKSIPIGTTTPKEPVKQPVEHPQKDTKPTDPFATEVTSGPTF